MPIISVTVSAGAAQIMRTQARRWHPRESGGVLVGLVEDGQAKVKQAVGPGPKAMHQPGLFLRDQEYAVQQVNLLHEQAGGLIDYIGEWHSHSRVQGPSVTDITSMLRISQDGSNTMRFPVLIIAMRRRREWIFKAYTPDEQTLVEIALVFS